MPSDRRPLTGRVVSGHCGVQLPEELASDVAIQAAADVAAAFAFSGSALDVVL